MAFPATDITLAQVWADACAQAASLKQLATTLRNNSAAGPIPRQNVLDFMRQLSNGLSRWSQAAATPGVAAYAQDQVNDPALDVAAEFTAMVNAATTLRDWISTNFPKDGGSGAWLVSTYGADGRPTSLTFTTAQLATFRTSLDAFVATIA